MFIAETFHRVSLQEVEKGAKPAEAYNYALEILITKSELEEKNGLASFSCWWHGLARNMIYFFMNGWDSHRMEGTQLIVFSSRKHLTSWENFLQVWLRSWSRRLRRARQSAPTSCASRTTRTWSRSRRWTRRRGRRRTAWARTSTRCSRILATSPRTTRASFRRWPKIKKNLSIQFFYRAVHPWKDF